MLLYSWEIDFCFHSHPSPSSFPPTTFPFSLFSAHFIINNEFNTIYQTNLWKFTRKIPLPTEDTKNSAPRLMTNNHPKKYPPFTRIRPSANIKHKCAGTSQNLVIARTTQSVSSLTEWTNCTRLTHQKISFIERRHASHSEKRAIAVMVFDVSFPTDQPKNANRKQS